MTVIQKSSHFITFLQFLDGVFIRLWWIKHFLTQIWISVTDYEVYVFHTIYMLLAIICREADLWKTLVLNVFFQQPGFCSVVEKDIALQTPKLCGRQDSTNDHAHSGIACCSLGTSKLHVYQVTKKKKLRIKEWAYFVLSERVKILFANKLQIREINFKRKAKNKKEPF